MPQIAISADFLLAFSRVPRAQQRKVRDFITRFQLDPTQRSINYEPIHDTLDDRVRTVRIGLDYRAIVLHPDQGDTYLLAWIDHHDEAMDWARRKRFEVNPVTGALQVIDTKLVDQLDAPYENVSRGEERLLSEYLLFETLSDEDLLRAGLPAPLLPAVRPLKTAKQLDEVAPYLPEEAYEALYWIANFGYSVDQALAEAGSGHIIKPIDVKDFDSSLDNLNSRRRYTIVNSSDELAEMLNQPLALWRVFLHPSQYNLVHREYGGPARVLGGAGTGKTVVAMHRARHLAAEVFTLPTDRVLFTTYTRNLALNIRENLSHLCGPEFDRIEVVNLHSWAVRFLRSQGFEFEIATSDEVRKCWDEAISVTVSGTRSEDFYLSEWDNVVKAQGITDRAGYMRARRHGQGVPLDRKQRAQVWEVLSEFKRRLADIGKIEWMDVITEAHLFLAESGSVLPYRAVVVDETQDLTPEELRLLRQIVPEGKNDLFLVGDAHQRIYGRPIIMSHCGIDIRGRSRKLKINYRTTEEIRRWAMAVLRNLPIDDLDGGLDDVGETISLRNGALPTIMEFETREQELAFVAERITEMVTGTVEAEDICLVGRTKRQLEDAMAMLDKSELDYLYLDRDTSEDSGSGVRLATMHRVKGLEFAHMILTAVNDRVVPFARSNEKELDGNYVTRERCVLHVAASRARDTLTITSYGKASPFLAELR